MADPYAALADGLRDRKRAYLRALIAPDEKDGVAKRRGYLKGNHYGHEGRRPTATPEEKKAARDRSDKDQAVWYDEPALRADPPDMLSDENVNMATARLAQWQRPPDGRPFAPPFPLDVPPLDRPAPVAQLLSLCGKMGVSTLDSIKGQLVDHDFPQSLVDDIAAALGDEAQQPENPPPIDPTGGGDTRSRLLALLPPPLVERIFELKAMSDVLTASHRIPNLLERVPDGIEFLARLGPLRYMTLRRAFVELAAALLSAPRDDDRLKRIDRSPFQLPVMFVRPKLTMPADFEWPDWSAAGLYWWRAVLFHHGILHILSTIDTADFHVTDLLRFYCLNKDQPDDVVPRYVKADIKICFQHFKYWIDEPPAFDHGENEAREMTFWSENHQIQFYQSQYLMGQLFASDRFPGLEADSSKWPSGQQLSDRALPRLNRWLDFRLRFGFSEWNAPGYYNEDFPPVFNLADFCKADDPVRTKAEMVLDLLFFDLARLHCRGSFGVTAGRAYWEHKNYGWEQSVGDTIEVLLGTRGDFVGNENTAIAFCTSGYRLPSVLLAIGTDRSEDDVAHPFVDRSRMSVTFDEARQLGIGTDKEDDVVFWWGNGGYFASELMESTKKVVLAHPNLPSTPPFNLLFKLKDKEFVEVLYDIVETAVGVEAVSLGLAGLLPFPLNVLAIGLGGKAALEGFLSLIEDAPALLKKVWDGIFGGDDDDKPKIPESVLQKTLESLLTKFNTGSVLSRVNAYTFTNGDAMLSSVQNHLKGEMSFQKQSWQATLGTDACVWTNAPMPEGGSFWSALGREVESAPRVWLEFFKDLMDFAPTKALTNVAVPILPELNLFGHDGLNYWTGSLALPMVVQHENAAIIAYNLTNFQRAASDAVTHAWFPRRQFTAVDQIEVDEGMWTFGMKAFDHGREAYIGLFSAQGAKWADDDSPWKDKELIASGGSNIWVAIVGNKIVDSTNRRVASSFASYEDFKDQVKSARLSISGIGTWNEVHCSFDIPQLTVGDGRAPRLSLHYSSDTCEFAGEPLAVDEFPRWQNQYVHGKSDGRVDWAATEYSFTHARTGLLLRHRYDLFPDGIRNLSRVFNQQPPVETPERRLEGGSLTTKRTRPTAAAVPRRNQLGFPRRGQGQ